MLGPAVVVASGWGQISVVPARRGGGMAILEVVVVVERGSTWVVLRHDTCHRCVIGNCQMVQRAHKNA